MTRNVISLVAAALLLSAPPLKACPLEGYWKSDEAKTLASFYQSKKATEKQKALFSTNFFGKLYVHIECNRFTAVMDDWIDTTRYELISSSENSVTTKYHSELEGEVVRETTIEGECYSLSILDGQFKEYFCPTSAGAFKKAVKAAQRAVQDHH